MIFKSDLKKRRTVVVITIITHLIIQMMNRKENDDKFNKEVLEEISSLSAFAITTKKIKSLAQLFLFLLQFCVLPGIFFFHSLTIL
jgi:hypothetical protein